MRLDRLHRAYPSLHPFGVVHWVPVLSNIKIATGCESNRQLQLWTVFTGTVVYNYQFNGIQEWAGQLCQNKMPGCHLTDAWRSHSKHILQWRYYTTMKYQFIHSFIDPITSGPTSLWQFLAICTLIRIVIEIFLSLMSLLVMSLSSEDLWNLWTTRRDIIRNGYVVCSRKNIHSATNFDKTGPSYTQLLHMVKYKADLVILI